MGRAAPKRLKGRTIAKIFSVKKASRIEGADGGSEDCFVIVKLQTWDTDFGTGNESFACDDCGSLYVSSRGREAECIVEGAEIF